MNVFVTSPQQSYCTQAKRYESQEAQPECYLDFEIEDNLVGQLIIALADRERVLQEKLSNISATWSRVDFLWKFITTITLIAIRTEKILKKQNKK